MRTLIILSLFSFTWLGQAKEKTFRSGGFFGGYIVHSDDTTLLKHGFEAGDHILTFNNQTITSERDVLALKKSIEEGNVKNLQSLSKNGNFSKKKILRSPEKDSY